VEEFFEGRLQAHSRTGEFDPPQVATCSPAVP